MVRLLGWLALLLFWIRGSKADLLPISFGKPCDGYPQSEVYCYGDFLHTAQRAKIFADGRTLVDTPLKFDPEVVLERFDKLGLKGDHLTHTEKKELEDFIEENFDKSEIEFEPWIPNDWDDSPPFLNLIADEKLRDWGTKLHNIWKKLGRQMNLNVKNNRRRHSLYYLSHPGIIAHSKSKKFYSWDTYWVVRGLLVSGMTGTVQEILLNMLELVAKFKFVPASGRIYDQRAQPPLLLPMIDSYFEATKDLAFIKDNIRWMLSEFEFFMENRTVSFKLGDNVYRMVYYKVDITGPRPEAYNEDYELINNLTLSDTDKVLLYANLKSGVESGWEFSSRWFIVDKKKSITDGLLQDTNLRDIIPVDLNSYLCWNTELLTKFCNLIGNTNICDPVEYLQMTLECKRAIYEVLWDEDAGIWFDYDFVRGTKRKYFFPTNIAPLWAQAHHGDMDGIARRVTDYFQITGAINYPGGLPTSMLTSGQQWDFPYSWPVLNHIVIEALENTKVKYAQDLAFQIAQKWVRSNHAGFIQSGAMFEKYNATMIGVEEDYGDNETLGYAVTNGVILDLLKTYGATLTPLPKLPAPFKNQTKSSAHSTRLIAGAWTLCLFYAIAIIIM